MYFWTCSEPPVLMSSFLQVIQLNRSCTELDTAQLMAGLPFLCLFQFHGITFLPKYKLHATSMVLSIFRVKLNPIRLVQTQQHVLEAHVRLKVLDHLHKILCRAMQWTIFKAFQSQLSGCRNDVARWDPLMQIAPWWQQIRTINWFH